MKPKPSAPQCIYYILLFGLTGIYITFIPFLLDYYIVRPECGFFAFYSENLLFSTYTYEGTVMLFLLAALYCLTANSAVSVTLVSAFLFLLTHASYIKYLNRRELLRLADLKLTETAGMALGYLRFHPDGYLLVLAGTLLGFTAAFAMTEYFRKKVQTPKASRTSKKRTFLMTGLRCAGAVLMIVALCLYSNRFFHSKTDINKIDLAIVTDTDANRYVLYRFLKNDRYTAISVENVEESYNALLSGEATRTPVDSGEYPDIIVIMNESFWDTDQIDRAKISFSIDPMQPYKDLKEKCSLGYLTSNVYGGGTVSSEAEFLTGINTKYHVTASGIFYEIKDTPVPSVADYFRALRYQTVAIHPYYGTMYSRRQVYENMRFDRILFEEDMEYRELFTRYISDRSLASQIIAEYEKSPAANKFIWALSIANHKEVLEYGEEPQKPYDFPIAVDFQDDSVSESDRQELISFVNGIYLANQAFADLVAYFESSDKPVILIMYGDHMPGLASDTLSALGIGGDSPEMLRKQYSVPVICFSNRAGDSSLTLSGESICYLPEMLIEYAGLPDSDMSRILRAQRRVFKTNSRNLITDREGNVIENCTEEQIELIRHIKAIEYDILYGAREHSASLWEPIMP